MTANPNRMTLYTNEQDKANIERLGKLLEAQGVDVRDERGNISTSKIFRLLVKAKLEELGG